VSKIARGLPCPMVGEGNTFTSSTIRRLALATKKEGANCGAEEGSSAVAIRIEPCVRCRDEEEAKKLRERRTIVPRKGNHWKSLKSTASHWSLELSLEA